MAKLEWDKAGGRIFETGIDRVVLYIPGTWVDPTDTYSPIKGSFGVAWNGVTDIQETTESSDPVTYYFNGDAYYTSPSVPGVFKATLTAFTYPDEFMPYDGYGRLGAGMLAHGQPAPGYFHLSYRTLVGNDVAGDKLGYKIHLLYNLRATPSTFKASSKAASVDPNDFSWEITGKNKKLRKQFPGRADTVHFVFDSRKIPAATMAEIETVLYGGNILPPQLLEPIDFLKKIFYVQDNGDGTATIYGSDAAVNWQRTPRDVTLYVIDSAGVTVVDTDSRNISDDY